VSEPCVGIIGVSVGNYRSVENAVHHLGTAHRPVTTPADCEGLTHLILPGVGAFRAVMQRLVDAGLDEAVRRFAATGRPVAGLCLGMQLLATTGTENGEMAGLGVVPGRVELFDRAQAPAVPHVGWNDVAWTRRHPVLKGVRTGVDFYFVHSYVFAAADQADVLGTTSYGQTFTSAVARRNVVGFQFHPEKSQQNGLMLLRRFVEWDGTC
jgi:glutamine amidotransferase